MRGGRRSRLSVVALVRELSPLKPRPGQPQLIIVVNDLLKESPNSMWNSSYAGIANETPNAKTTQTNLRKIAHSISAGTKSSIALHFHFRYTSTFTFSPKSALCRIRTGYLSRLKAAGMCGRHRRQSPKSPFRIPPIQGTLANGVPTRSAAWPELLTFWVAAAVNSSS